MTIDPVIERIQSLTRDLARAEGRLDRQRWREDLARAAVDRAYEGWRQAHANGLYATEQIRRAHAHAANPAHDPVDLARLLALLEGWVLAAESVLTELNIGR